MIKLEPGNVLLKPSSRRQFMGWLKRVARLGQRLGNFDLKITLSRIGNQLQAVASCRAVVPEPGHSDRLLHGAPISASRRRRNGR